MPADFLEPRSHSPFAKSGLYAASGSQSSLWSDPDSTVDPDEPEAPAFSIDEGGFMVPMNDSLSSRDLSDDEVWDEMDLTTPYPVAETSEDFHSGGEHEPSSPQYSQLGDGYGMKDYGDDTPGNTLKASRQFEQALLGEGREGQSSRHGLLITVSGPSDIPSAHPEISPSDSGFGASASPRDLSPAEFADTLHSGLSATSTRGSSSTTSDMGSMAPPSTVALTRKVGNDMGRMCEQCRGGYPDSCQVSFTSQDGRYFATACERCTRLGFSEVCQYEGVPYETLRDAMAGGARRTKTYRVKGINRCLECLDSDTESCQGRARRGPETAGVWNNEACSSCTIRKIQCSFTKGSVAKFKMVDSSLTIKGPHFQSGDGKEGASSKQTRNRRSQQVERHKEQGPRLSRRLKSSK